MTRETVMGATFASAAISTSVGCRWLARAVLFTSFPLRKRDFDGADFVRPGRQRETATIRRQLHRAFMFFHEIGFHSARGLLGQVQLHLRRLALEFVEAEN